MIGCCHLSTAMVRTIILPIESSTQYIKKDTIYKPITILKTKQVKQKKRNWLPKIRLRLLIVLFREKLKEREKRKRKPVYPVVDNGQKKTGGIRTK